MYMRASSQPFSEIHSMANTQMAMDITTMAQYNTQSSSLHQPKRRLNFGDWSDSMAEDSS